MVNKDKNLTSKQQSSSPQTISISCAAKKKMEMKVVGKKMNVVW